MDERFLHKMPKIELHAHLNGSLSMDAILELGKAVHGDSTPEFRELAAKFIHFENLQLDDCFQKFKFMHELTATRRGLAVATQLALRDFVKDNVVYLELRSTPKANEHMNKRQYLETVLDVMKEFSETPAGANMQVKLLPSIDRSQPATAGQEMLDAVASLSGHPHAHAIVGIDLSGNPKCGRFANFKPLLQAARDAGLKLTLHCAEVENAAEVAEMLAFGMERCGHGTYLSAEQIEQLGRQRTAIECCLTSNVKSGTVAGYMEHHFRGICERGNVPVVLCTDDCGVFDTTLTREYQIAVESYSLSKSVVQRLLTYAAEHAFATAEEKQNLRRIISEYFKQEHNQDSK